MKWITVPLLFITMQCFAGDGWYSSDDGNSVINVANENAVFINLTSSGLIFITHPYSKYITCQKNESVKVINVNSVDVKFSLIKENNTCVYTPISKAGSSYLQSEFLEPEIVLSDLAIIKGRKMPFTFNGNGYMEAVNKNKEIKLREQNAL